jgi:hypothetical protein
VQGVASGGGPTTCVNNGPPIVNPPGQGGCLGGLAATTFRWTLCSCHTVSLSDIILTDAFDSTKGPYKPGGVGGGVGADTTYSSQSGSTAPNGIWGDLWVYGGGINAADMVKHDLKSGGALGGGMNIGNDAWAKGNVSGVTIGGKLYVPSAGNATGVNPGGGVVVGPVSFPPPCDCPPDHQLIPVAAMVTAHQSPNNDNQSIHLSDNAFAGGGSGRLDLPCGSYYLSSINPNGPITIWAHGQTALYVDGNVSSGSTITIGVDPTASFDVFIKGTLSSSSGITIGSPNYPALTRTYVTGAFEVSSAGTFAGELYAAYGTVTWTNEADAYGSVFAGDFQAQSAAKIHYDLAVLQLGNACPNPNGGGTGGRDGGGTTGGDGGSSGGAGCGSCTDCLNQACIKAPGATTGQCGSCTTDSDCCSPLVCVNGSCQPAVH